MLPCRVRKTLDVLWDVLPGLLSARLIDFYIDLMLEVGMILCYRIGYFSGIGRIWEAAGRVAVYELQENVHVIVAGTPTLSVEEKDDLIRYDIDYRTNV